MLLSDRILAGDIPCLSVRQPWAWAIFNGKDVENRSWHPLYTGPILLHASATMGGKWDFHDDCEWVVEKSGVAIPEEIPLGAIIGVVEIVRIVANSTSPWASIGSLHWVMRPIVELAEPVSCVGALKLYWKYERGILMQVAEQLRVRGL